MTLALLGNTLLRTAITRNLVTFPAQIQPFMKRTTGDLQERIVQLYFVRGWTVRNICHRYGMSKAMVHKLLAEWRIRAVESGYIQEVEPDCLSVLEADGNSDSVETKDSRNNGSDERYREVAVEKAPEAPDAAHLIYAGSLPPSVTESPATFAAGRSA